MPTLHNAYRGIALRNRPAIFRSLAVAEAALPTFTKATWLIMGEPGEYVAVCPADFSRLERAGYMPVALG